MKNIIITTIIATITFGGVIMLNQMAWQYKYDKREKEYKLEKTIADSTIKVLSDRFVNPDKYKPRKVKYSESKTSSGYFLKEDAKKVLD